MFIHAFKIENKQFLSLKLKTSSVCIEILSYQRMSVSVIHILRNAKYSMMYATITVVNIQYLLMQNNDMTKAKEMKTKMIERGRKKNWIDLFDLIFSSQFQCFFFYRMYRISYGVHVSIQIG